MGNSYDDYLGKDRRKRERFNPCSQVLKVEIDLFFKNGGQITKLKSDERQSRTCYVPMTNAYELAMG